MNLDDITSQISSGLASAAHATASGLKNLNFQSPITVKMPSTYLITGVSSGIGLELCKQLADRGDIVIGTVRKRNSSMSKEDKISEYESKYGPGGLLYVIEGIDVSDDGVGEKLLNGLKEKGIEKIDVVIHNAGTYSEGKDDRTPGSDTPGAQQSFKNVGLEAMRRCYEINCLGVLKVQQALLDLCIKGSMEKKKSGKVVIISTGLGSISDNGSGSNYAYRSSKTAVNMVGKCMACDFKVKEKDPMAGDYGLVVGMIAPGFVETEFGPGKTQLSLWGAKKCDEQCCGILKCIDEGIDSMEKSGRFWSVKGKEEYVEFPW